MNRKREPYDRYSVGERIQKRRQSLGLSQEKLAEQMDRATKYCSDIERGTCGMSLETMLSFSLHLNMSLDYMMFGLGDKPDLVDPDGSSNLTFEDLYKRHSSYFIKAKLGPFGEETDENQE